MSGVHEGFITEVAQRLRQGQVIAYPTEAVWGLGCDPNNEQAVARILALKSRPMAKGMIMVSGNLAHFTPWLEALPLAAREQVQASWPGPNTWLVPDPVGVPRWVKGDHEQVALRCSAHPLIKALCDAFGGPIISTSANPASLPPARTEAQVRQYFGDALDAIVPGELGGLAQPTPIRDALTGAILRV